MDDLISRQAAIDAVSNGCQEWRGIFKRCEEKILALQSAQPERKKGKWFEVDPYMVICPFCKHASSRKNFCAECGADMRGESDG